MRRFFYITLSACCLLATLFMIIVFNIGLREVRGYPDAPRRQTLVESIGMLQAGQTPWVWLTDVEADCARFALARRGSGDDDVTVFVARNASRTHEVIIEALGRRSCSQIVSQDLYGVLQPLRDADRNGYRRDGLPLADNDGPQWRMCGACGPANSKNGLGLAVVIIVVLAGLTVYLFLQRNPRP